MSEVIGMYGTISGGTENALASIDIPQDGFIIGIDWDLSVNMDADNENAAAELSFIATNQLSTNDVRGRLSSVSTRLAVLDATGPQAVTVQKWLGSFDLAVSGGERLYLHANSTSGVNGDVRCNLFVDLGSTVRRSARRR